MLWNGRNVLVTGGASFIGSHLVDALVDRGARVRVVDDLTSGKLENIRRHVEAGRVEFRSADLLADGVAREAVHGMDVVFHLAAIHGGRGFVDLHQAACAQNLGLDSLVIREAHRAGVERFVFASSGCVYPNFRQKDVTQELYLSEEMAGPPYDCDGAYGWAKMMGELTLRAYHKDFGFKSASCRFFTVYGERGIENHAVMAMIARAFIKQNPYEVWGNGEQIRNWTHVRDIVSGLILSAERIEDGRAVNLGTMERTRVIDAVYAIFEIMGHHAEIKFLPQMPTGPYNRVADNRLARELLGWEPQVKFLDGLKRTIDWYCSVKKPDEVRAILGHMLTGR